jgi:hypothetical protein
MHVRKLRPAGIGQPVRGRGAVLSGDFSTTTHFFFSDIQRDRGWKTFCVEPILTKCHGGGEISSSGWEPT